MTELPDFSLSLTPAPLPLIHASNTPQQQLQQQQTEDGQQPDPASPTKGRKVGVSAAQDGGGKGMVDTNPPRGTRDFLPDDMRLRNWLFGHWASVARGFGFEQFDVPVLESEELFVRKAGEEITDQLYNFEVRLCVCVWL